MTRLALFLLLAGVTVAGCRQGLNDSCQVSSDCEDGLICVLPVGGTPQSGGLCETPEGMDMTSTNDFSMSLDLSSSD